MFGKLMSISDDLMWRYFELLSFRPLTEITTWQKDIKSGTVNPRDIKVKLALEIVARFHSKILADKASEEFTARFKNKVMPTNIETITVNINDDEITLGSLLKLAGLTASSSEANRLIKQGGVKINAQKVEDHATRISKNTEHTYQVGKLKFARIKVIGHSSNFDFIKQ